LVGKEIIVKISDAEILNHQMLDKNVFYCILYTYRFPRRYDEKCKGKTTPDCTPNRWIIENIPNGEYEASVGVRHNNAAFTLDMQVNGSPVYNNLSVP
jgi:hypothetical protein